MRPGLRASTGRLVHSAKMRRARELLTLPNIRVKGVAARLGCTDPLYFGRIFKQIVGLPPEAYSRKAARMHGL